ncbi:MAG: protein kinase domain-containing protein, partial [Bacteroidota bacterium]
MVGQIISQYKIIEKLGEGGMGVVYKAQDTKLDRFVALKFLPPHMAASEQDKARFIQEAKSAAALNHPNVCSIIDIQEHEKNLFIVMEYVDGQTLMDKKSSISLKQAIEIGIQIADGLAVAHEKGIIHRDIKPENIMVRKDGIVQIMDFGLAKLAGTSRLTKMGSTVGTLGYMSPEQVQGIEADHRSDIFSLGVLLYEMIAGRSPFNGAHESAILYEIVNVDVPPMVTIKPELDPALDAIVLECLEKDPTERYQSIAEVSKELRRFKRESSRSRASRTMTPVGPNSKAWSNASAASPVRSGNSLLRIIASPVWVILSALFLIAAMVLLLVPNLSPFRDEKKVIRAFIPSPDQHNYSNAVGGGQIAISPDGSTIAFVAVDSSGNSSLWTRRIDALQAMEIQGTQGAAFPFWSPDNHYIGFFSNNKLKRVEKSGGPPFTICDVITFRGATWGKDGKIVLPVDQGTGLSVVSDAGGFPVQLTTLDTTKKEQTHRYPVFLPDGKHFLYFARTTASGSGSALDAICVGSVDGTVNKRLFNGISNAAYANGYLLYMRENSLMAHAFDPDALELKGDPFPIAESVDFSTRYSVASFTVSQNGVLVYMGKSAASVPELALFGPDGTKKRSFGQPEVFVNSRLSTDGSMIVMDLYEVSARNADVWLLDIVRGVKTRFTFDNSVDANPIWSPDGKSIIFSSNRNGHYDLYEKNTNGVTDEKLLLASPLLKAPSDWSNDGKYVLFTSSGDPKTKMDVWAIPMVGDRTPIPFVHTEFSEGAGVFSPDGKWVAYQSDESGKTEIYVRPFPGPGAKWQVSTSGGRTPFWKNNGKEIYYLNGGKIMAAQVNGSGQTFTVGAVREYFNPSEVGGINMGNGTVRDISPDGNSILLSVSKGTMATAPLT